MIRHLVGRAIGIGLVPGLLVACAHGGSGRPTPKQLGVNLVATDTTRSPAGRRCPMPSAVPVQDTVEQRYLAAAVAGWQQTLPAEQPCVTWFSRTKVGTYIGVQPARVLMDGGMLTFFPRDTTKERWVISPW